MLQLRFQVNEQAKGKLVRLIKNIESDFGGAAFQEIAQKLAEPLVEVANDNCMPDHTVESIIIKVQKILSALPDPNATKERFRFDAALIQEVMKELGADGTPLIPQPVVPKFATGGDWKHQPVLLPKWTKVDTDGHEPTVHVVTFPGHDELVDVELLQYPWLIHELAHFVIELLGTPFYERFGQFVERALASISFRSFASQDAARTFATTQSDALRRYWLPQNKKANWPIEIAADLMGVWVLGPAFIDAYVARVRHELPFLLEDIHPPYYARSQALYDAALRLGWDIEAKPLRDLLEGWRVTPQYTNRGNDYVNYVRQDLLEKCVVEGLGLWSEIDLPRCDSPRLERLRDQLRKGRPPGIGMDLILAYWLVESDPELSRLAGSTQKWVKRCAENVTMGSL